MVAAVNEVLEFRIHGIGNHPAWSALGSPQRVDQGRFPSIDQPADEGGARYRPAQDSWVDQFRPPDADPDIRLLVWSRTSRIVAGLLWFLAIPMTLVNIAARMAPPVQTRWSRLSQWALSITVHITSAVVTITLAVWAVALWEVMLKFVAGLDLVVVAVHVASVAGVIGAAWALGRGRRRSLQVLIQIAAIAVLIGTWRAIGSWGRGQGWTLESAAVYQWGGFVVCVVLALGSIVRKVTRESTDGLSWTTTLVHAGLFTAVGATLARWRPAQIELSTPLPVISTHDIDRNTGALTIRLDPLVLTNLGGCALVILLAAVLVVLALVTRSGASMPAAALSLVSGVVLIGALGSSLRFGLNYLFGIVQPIFFAVGWRPHAPPLADRLVTAYDDSYELVYRSDAGILAAVVLVVGLAAAGLWLWIVGRPDRHSGAAHLHSLVQALPTALAPASAVALVVVLSGLAGIAWGYTSALPPQIQVASILVIVVSSFGLLLLGGGQMLPVRDVLARFADVAGFWPVTVHPLSGAPYGPKVLKALAKAVADCGRPRVLVVGHSQGSVLAAALVARRFEAAGAKLPQVRLITCGSPLSSLYGTVFPRTFDEAFFRDVADATAPMTVQASESSGAEATPGWVNCWRSTDPIASAVTPADNLELPDSPPAGGRPLGHSDYWIDPLQLERGRRLSEGDW
jgi:hypothetical protein